jgi:hypothetical protein
MSWTSAGAVADGRRRLSDAAVLEVTKHEEEERLARDVQLGHLATVLVHHCPRLGHVAARRVRRESERVPN